MLSALFAETTAVVPDGVWMAAISMASVGMGYLFKYLGDKDKLRYDAKILGQDGQIAAQNALILTQGGQIAALTAGHAQCQEESAILKGKVEDLERLTARKVTALEDRDDADYRKLDSKITRVAEAAEAANGKPPSVSDDTDEHTPLT
jgi:hypothetical protein